MSISVTVNGQSFEVPETGEVFWGDETTGVIVELADSTLQLSTTAFPLSAQLDFTGPNLDHGLIAGNYSGQGIVASGGTLRLANTEYIAWRNSGNTADIILGITGDQISVGGVPLTTEFIGLTDTPAAYTGQTGKLVSVLATEDGVEFIDPSTVGVTDHTLLTSIGVNTHAAIDSHISDSTIHFTEGSISHLNITDIGTNSHVTLDAHLANSGIHFSVASIDHTLITNIGTNSHTAIDSHISDGTIHFTEASIVHQNISGAGTNTHSAIDSHISDGTIHFTQAAISITASQVSDFSAAADARIALANIDDLADVIITTPVNGEALVYSAGNWINGNSAAPVDSVFGRTGVVVSAEGDYALTQMSDVLDSMTPLDGQVLTFDTTNGWQAETNVSGVTDHTLLSNIGTNSHSTIDSHISDSTIHFTQAAISITKSQISDFSDGDYATAAQGTTADSATQPGDNLSTLTNDSGFITDITGESIKDLSDVFTTMTPTDGQALIFDTTNGWQAETLSPGGVTDHGALTGLADDDHSQYHNDTRGDARYYTKTLLDGGQLDNRYYTETEIDANIYTKTQSDANFISVVATPTAGNFAQLTAGGELVNSIYDETSFATAAQGSTADSALQDITGESIKDLSDVFTTMTPSDGQALVFDTTNGWQAETLPTVITDHGGLTGLADDDHTQYHNDTRGDARYYTQTQLDGGQLDSQYISIVVTPTAGNFAQLTAGGELVNSIYDETSFATAAQGTLADSATQPGDNISTLTNDSGFISDITGESIGDLNDVVLTGLAVGDIISYDGADWVNSDSVASLEESASTLFPFMDGTTLDPTSFTVTSNGTTVSANSSKSGGGNYQVWLDNTNQDVVAGSVTLAAGTDTDPTENFVFIELVVGVATIKSNTTGFPNSPYAALGKVVVQSAVSVQSYGAYKVHQWADHVADDNIGHLSHINEWIRHQDATWHNGIAPTISITTNGGAADNVFFDNDSGEVYQLHLHDFPLKDMSTGDGMYVINDSTVANRRVSDMNEMLTDSNGVSMSGRSFSIVVWGVASEDDPDCKLFANLPTNSYAANQDANSVDDTEGYALYSIPHDYIGTGFLIARVTLKHTTVNSGTWVELQTEDLRGLSPNTAAGAGGGGGGITDHGLLSGLSDDDHMQYALSDGSRGDFATLAQGALADTALQDITGEVIGDLSDVNVPSPTDQDVLTWDNGTSKWISQAGGGAVDSVFGRTGTVIAVEGDYDLDELGDVVITTPATDDVLGYDGVNWVNTQPIVVDLDELGDVNAPTPTDQDVLTWDNTAGEWISQAGSGGVTDHGALTGLADDDHTQYHNDTRGDARYSLLAHTHEGNTIDATAITDGFVLTADGAGNAAWEVAASGANNWLVANNGNDFASAPSAAGTNDITIGNGSANFGASGENIALGSSIAHNSINGIFIGENSTDNINSPTNAIAIGVAATAQTSDSIAFGANAFAGVNALQIRVNATVSASTFDMTSVGVISCSGTAAQFQLPSYTTAGLPTGSTGGQVWDTTTSEVKVYDGAAWQVVGPSNVVEDTTPQLGGDLDVNGNDIISVSNGDINITPNGTGKTVVTNLEAPTPQQTQTGTTYTAVIGDADKMITMSNASANTMTIPANASVAYPVGTKLNFMQLGAGQTTVAITTDTLNVESTLTLKLTGQYAVATAFKITSTTWVLFGNLEAA